MIQGILIFALLVAATLCGFGLGYVVGVEETERRWSDAVAQGDYARESEQKTEQGKD